jgi:PQQ-dependent dehydrogenase (methanol/ethanol family)
MLTTLLLTGALLGPDDPSPPVRGIYVNAWIFGTRRFYNLVQLADATEINAFVIDVKDDTGYLTYRSSVPTAVEIGANTQLRARDARERIALLKSKGIRAIARIVVAKDPLLALKKPQWSVQRTSGGRWTDRQGSYWVDAFNDSVWVYAGQLAAEAVRLGFEEVQYDYVRFPDEPKQRMAEAVYGFRREAETVRDGVNRNLALLALRTRALRVRFTIDVFGLTTTADGDMGIGQSWEDLVTVADVVLPMIYPSHYGRGVYGVARPNAAPYTMVKRALEDGLRRSRALAPRQTAEIRPYLQAFTLGPPKYTAHHVREQIRAVNDLGLKSWVLWNPRSAYERAYFKPDSSAPGPPQVPRPQAVLAGEWPMTGRDYGLTRYSPLDQITTANVAELRPVWSFATGAFRAHEGNPLVIGGTMYVHTPYPNVVYAIDLSRPGGTVQWKYSAPLPKAVARGAQPAEPAPMPTGCCDVGNRGLAYHPSGKLYAALLNGDLAALDARTGREIWRVRNARSDSGGTVASAPLVVRDLVLIGESGAEYGVRGHLSAYHALTGRLVWRGWSTGPDTDVLIRGPANTNYRSHQGRDLGVSTWPAEMWRQGGGTASGWISHDPALDLVYYGTDQAAPGTAAQRPGDNKWTSTIFAREASTGRVRWAYQVTPHDEWGYGGANENILVDLPGSGAPLKALVHFDRNGFAYTIDRATGRVIVAERYGPANWARVVDLGSGLPTLQPSPVGKAGLCPAAIGTKFLQPAAFSPLTNLFYVPLNNVCMERKTGPVVYVPGQLYLGTRDSIIPGPGGNRGRFIAWNASTATIAWEVREPLTVASGALTTAGGLVFYGTMEGWLKALDQQTGRELWRFQTPSGIVGNPMSFSGPDGKQYIAVFSGVGGWWALRGNGAALDSAATTPREGMLMVFGL